MTSEQQRLSSPTQPAGYQSLKAVEPEIVVSFNSKRSSTCTTAEGSDHVELKATEEPEFAVSYISKTSSTCTNGEGSNKNVEHDRCHDEATGASAGAGAGAVVLSRIRSRFASVDRDALHFGIRMSVTLTLAFVFALVPSYKHGIWVPITVLFVSWFPNLDAASVIEKSMQRLIGTFVGAFMGLACGFLSLTMPSGRSQDWFVAFCFGAGTFAVCFSICQFKIGGAKIISKYSYASVLCMLTFIISLTPFCDDRQWRSALYRIMNVALGCVISAAGAVLVLPRSMTSMIQERIERQIKLAGESSEAVLHAAADVFYGGIDLPPLAEELLEGSKASSACSRRCLQKKKGSFHSVKLGIVNLRGDAALEKCESAIQDWKVTKSLFSLLRFDPFHLVTPSEMTSMFHAEAADTLARALRIQTTVVLIDGIVRNDPHHDFDDGQLELLTDTGSLIRKMLTVPLDEGDSRAAAEALMGKLARVRAEVVRLSAVVATSPGEMPDPGTGGGFEEDGDGVDRDVANAPRSPTTRDFERRLYRMDTFGTRGRGTPKYIRGSNVCALLFLQLVDHLILRSLRLYVAWSECEDKLCICRHPSLLQLHNS